MKATLLFLACLGIALASATPSIAAPRKYAVIFEVNLNAQGEVLSVAVEKVIDPKSGSTSPVDVAVPERFVAACRDIISQSADSSRPMRYFTYFFYDPDQPDRVGR
ncbi:MAG TPA: hypothetical protein VJR87_04735 [Allosphingosinicella sp.]|nr:hypothetical protein [Allosphingosinicella sp.]